MMNSPCEKCPHYNTCGLKCAEFKEWFSQEWRRVRKLFGIEGDEQSDEEGGDV